MTNTLPETWKFATLQQDGSLEIQWQIRQPYRSMGINILKEGDFLYSERKLARKINRSIEQGRQNTSGHGHSPKLDI